jgi:hypothetical protein
MHGVVVTPPSTVGEHRDLVIRENVCTNAPGRIEGRCEHHDLAVARSRDMRHGGIFRERARHGIAVRSRRHGQCEHERAPAPSCCDTGGGVRASLLEAH